MSEIFGFFMFTFASPDEDEKELEDVKEDLNRGENLTTSSEEENIFAERCKPFRFFSLSKSKIWELSVLLPRCKSTKKSPLIGTTF